MKILFAHHIFSNFGGGEKVLFDEMRLLEENGHEVYVFATDKQPYLIENYAFSHYFPKYIDFQELSRVERLKHFLGTIYNTEAKNKFSLYVDKIKPDLVHCHNIFYYLTPSILDVCVKKRIPVVMTLHDSRLVCPAATLRLNDREYCKNELCITGNAFHCLKNKCKYNSLVSSGLVVTDYYFRKLSGFIEKISKIICPSEALASLVSRSGVRLGKIEVINNFVDEQYFEIKPDYKDAGYFLYAGRLLNVKGLDTLLKAMALNRDIKLKILGVGPEETNLKSLASELKLENVEFSGYKSGNDLALSIKGCVSTILPSNWFENYPLSIIESFCYGKPVIGSNVGGIPELINKDKNGIIFEMGNEKELSIAIRYLYENRDLVRQLGSAARRYAEKKFRKKFHYERLHSVYSGILGY